MRDSVLVRPDGGCGTVGEESCGLDPGRLNELPLVEGDIVLVIMLATGAGG